MSTWAWIVVAAATTYLLKLVGYLLPKQWLQRPWVPALATALTVGLLASLTATNALADGRSLVLDSRLLALAAAGIALWRKAPFIVVVIIGAAVAALGRLAGLP